MESNIRSYNHNVATCEMFASKIDWNDMSQDGHYQTIELVTEDGTVAGKLCDMPLDIVIGTDVVYWRTQIEPLIDTLEVLHRENPGLKIYICYVERHVNTHTELKEAMARRNFVLTEFG